VSYHPDDTNGGSAPRADGGATPRVDGGSAPRADGGATPRVDGGSAPLVDGGTPRVRGKRVRGGSPRSGATSERPLGAAEGQREEAEEVGRFLELSLDLLGVAGFDGYLKRVTSSWERVLGYSEQELLTRPFIEFVHPDDHPKIVAGMKELEAGGDLMDFEVRTRLKDGSYRWFVWSAKASVEEQRFYAVGKDVTERRRLEEDNTRFVQLSIDTFGVGGFDGYLKRVNPTWEKVFGWSEAELLNRPYIEFIHPEDHEKVIAAVSNLLSGIDVKDLELRTITKDGPSRWFSWSATPSVEEEAFYLVGKDVTARRALEEESTRFIDVSPDLFCIVDFEGSFHRVNPALAHVLGYPPEELAGRPYADFIHPDDLERTLAEAESLASHGGETRDFPSRILSRDGSYRSVLWTSKSSPDERIIYATGRDITEREQVEEAAYEAEERFEAAFEQAPIGMSLVGIEREQPGAFLRVNRALCDITGLTEDALVGTDFQAIVHPDDVASELHYVRWMLTGDIAQYEVEKRLRHADGHTLWALVTVSMVRDARDRPLYLISQIQDVTARKEAEREMWESRERLQDIIDNTTAVIYLKDQDGRYLLVNDRFEMRYGIRRDEAVGKTDHDLFSPEMADALRAKDLKVIATGIALEVEEVIHDPDGAQTFLSNSFPLFHANDPKGAPYAVCTISADITERKQAEEALRWSEEHFRRIVDTAQIAFISIDGDGLITAWNPQAERTFGWSASEAIGERISRTIIPQRYREAHGRGLEQFLATGRGPLLDRRFEIEALHRDGHEFPVELSITPVRVNGEYSFNAFLNDITERRGAVENLRQLANIVESSSDAMITMTLDGEITSWNPGAEHLYGYPAEEAIGQRLHMIVPTHRAGEEDGILESIRAGHKMELGETERVRKDGSLVDVTAAISPIKDAVGKVVGASSISRDITARKRADRAIREVQLGFRSAFEHAPIGMALFSVASQDRGRPLEVNRSLSEITGYSTQQLLEMDLRDITHPDDASSEQPLMDQLLSGEVPNYTIEKRYVHQDGHTVWVTHSASTVHDSADRLLYGVSQVEDITKRKRAEEELANLADELEQRATELERSNADLQQFAYAASHDLSEPLRMVSSYVQLLAKRYKDKLDSDADEFIDFAVDGTTRMQALIDGLLIYSRAGTADYTHEPVDCSKVLHETLVAIHTTLRETGTVVNSTPLPTVQGDPTQLSQLFQNLVSNAIKFAADEPPRIDISAEQEDGAWSFRVTDNGIGIDPAHAERIFAVFQRLHGRGEYPGSGVGLAICKRIVERHNGRIWVERPPDGGSTFCFTIPVDERGTDKSLEAN
jgi:PAS domain S-box-containing protein